MDHPERKGIAQHPGGPDAEHATGGLAVLENRRLDAAIPTNDAPFLGGNFVYEGRCMELNKDLMPGRKGGYAEGCKAIQTHAADLVLRRGGTKDKAAEAKKDVKHWKAQVDGLEESLKATKAALATSHAEPVVPGVSIANDGTVAFNATDGLIAAQNGAGAALAMAGEAAKTGYQALVDAIPTEEAKKLGEDAVDAMYGAVDKGKAKTAEAYGNAWGYAVANEYVAPATQSQVEEKVSVAYSKAASITSDVCYDKIPSLYEKHAKKYVDAALVEIGERKALATVELRELFAHAQQALHDRVQQLKEKLPTSADLKSRADSAREVVALRFHALLVAAGACDETYEPCAPAKRLASACVACWAAAACVLLLIAAYHLVGMLLGLAKRLVVAVGKRAVRLPLMLIKLAIALVVLAVSLALKLALLPLRIVLLPVTLPLALLARKKGPAKASSRPPRKNSPARGRR